MKTTPDLVHSQVTVSAMRPVASANPLWAALIVTVMAVLVLIGWVLDIGILKSAVPGYVEMKVNTAVCFVCAALALVLQRNAVPGQRWVRTVARFAAGAVVFIGGFSLAV